MTTLGIWFVLATPYDREYLTFAWAITVYVLARVALWLMDRKDARRDAGPRDPGTSTPEPEAPTYQSLVDDKEDR